MLAVTDAVESALHVRLACAGLGTEEEVKKRQKRRHVRAIAKGGINFDANISVL